MSLHGNPDTLKRLAKNLRALPTTVSMRVAERVAPLLSERAASAYASGQTVYGDARPAGKHGNSLDLHVTGTTQGRVQFAAIGTVVRARLGTRYARFLIGKYRVLPMGRLPVAWSEDIGRIAREEIQRGLHA
jgi:hypothetical protein